MSTPLQFASQQCANYALGGSCKGIGIRDKGSLFMFGSKPACLLTQRGARCRYFEECVLPMGIEPCNAVNIQREKEHQEAIRLYSPAAPDIAKASGRLCSGCRKREVEPRKRFCYVCAYDRETARKRDWATRTRKQGSDVAKTEKTTVDNT
jgi:hypothetical protein